MRVRLMFLVVLAAACGSSEQPPNTIFEPGKGDSLQGDSPFLLIDDDIVIYDSGTWNKTVGCSGICVEEYKFWVDLGVKNRSATKYVSINWGMDGHWQEAVANRTGDFENGYEKWHVEVRVGTFTSRPVVKMAASVCYDNQCADDQRSWANNDGNNYEVFSDYPTLARPVKRVSHEAAFVGGQARVFGSIATYPFAGQRAVKVVYSLDDWASQPRIAEAVKVNDRSWTFEVIEPSSAADLPEKISFALVYEVTLGSNRLEAWTNNGSGNFSAYLGPQVYFESPYAQGAVCGLLGFEGSTRAFTTRVSAEAICWDGTCAAGNRLTHSTAADADGAHEVEYQVTFDDGSTVVRQLTVNVSNRISARPRWTSAVHVGVETNGVVQVASGALVVAHGARDIVRHDPGGSTLAFATLPGDASCEDLAIDDQDRVYALAYRGDDVVLYRFDSNGVLDTTFGWSGELRLPALSASPSLARSALEVTTNGIHVTSAWYGSDSKLYSYDLAGQWVATFDLDSWRNINDVVGRNGELWVLTDEFQLIRFAEKTDGSGTLVGLEEQQRSTLSIPRDRAADAMELGLSGDGGLWVLAGSAANSFLARTDAAGSLLGIWHSASTAGAPDVDGWFDTQSSLLIQSDGSALVLNGSTPIFQTFTFAP